MSARIEEDYGFLEWLLELERIDLKSVRRVGRRRVVSGGVVSSCDVCVVSFLIIYELHFSTNHSI